jgi:hypothetical protein
MLTIYETREELVRDLAKIREMRSMKKLAEQHAADLRKVMENRAKYSPEELELLDREAMQKIEAWARGDVP